MGPEPHGAALTNMHKVSLTLNGKIIESYMARKYHPYANEPCCVTRFLLNGCLFYRPNEAFKQQKHAQWLHSLARMRCLSMALHAL